LVIRKGKFTVSLAAAASSSISPLAAPVNLYPASASASVRESLPATSTRYEPAFTPSLV